MTLLTALDNGLTAAQTSAQAGLADTQTKMDAAVAAVDTQAGDCLEGMIALDAAWQAVAATREAAGRAAALREIVDLGTVSATVLTAPPATGNIDLTSLTASAATRATAAATAASDALAYVLSREQLVRDAFKTCVTAGVLGPLLGVAQACVSSATTALNQAVTNLADPGPPPGATAIPNDNLRNMVAALINRGANRVLTDDCNIGVFQLKLVVDLLTAARDRANALSACLGELGAIAPADPFITSGQAALTAAQTQITQNLLDLDPGVVTTWTKRVNCLLKSHDIVVKVRDESNDQIGRGVQVSVGNPVINALLPLPPISAPTECPGSQITFRNVPMAAIPLAPPAGAPPKPPGVPDLPNAATLVFNVAAGGGRTFAASVDPNGFLMGSDRLTISLQLDEVSSLTSC